MKRYADAVMAGYGGQGVLFAGQLLAWAAMLDGLNVTWFPSYGAEIRGGIANCTVIMSEREVGSPIIERPMALIAFNSRSFERFSSSVKKGGLIILNSSLIKADSSIKGVRVVKVPANEAAADLGDPMALNMVMLGAYLGASRAVGLDSALRALDENLPPRRKYLMSINAAALSHGFRAGSS